MLGYFLYNDFNNNDYYLVTIDVYDCESNYDYNKEYYTNNFKITNINDIYGNTHYFFLSKIHDMEECTFCISKEVVMDKLYDKYINSDIDLKIAKEINLYKYDGELLKTYFMNNFKIEGECKKYENGKLYSILNYIDGKIVN